MCGALAENCPAPDTTIPWYTTSAPFACFVIRHMDVRDIVFLGHNRAAFRRYRARFAPLFAAGEVSNEFGYVDMYDAAVGRFPE